MRQDHELPECTKRWGWKYHHTGIPTNQKLSGEQYLPHLKMYVSGFGSSPFGIEWMRFEPGSPVPHLVQTTPHIAFLVGDLEQELSKREFNVIVEPQMPANGIRVTMFEHNGAPIELLEFSAYS